MKTHIILILLFFYQPVFSQDECEKRLRVSEDQFTGTRIYSSPTISMKPFRSMWAPQLVLSKTINKTGEASYFLSFVVSGARYVEGKEYNNNCIVLFENGERIEKTTEVTVSRSAYSDSYSTILPLDSADLRLLKNYKMKAVRLISYDIDEIKTPEFYIYYINCLINKQ